MVTDTYTIMICAAVTTTGTGKIRHNDSSLTILAAIEMVNRNVVPDIILASYDQTCTSTASIIQQEVSMLGRQFPQIHYQSFVDEKGFIRSNATPDILDAFKSPTKTILLIDKAEKAQQLCATYIPVQSPMFGNPPANGGIVVVQFSAEQMEEMKSNPTMLPPKASMISNIFTLPDPSQLKKK